MTARRQGDRQALTVGHVCAALERWAPRAWAYTWDKPGLAIGNASAPVRRVVTCLSVEPSVLRAARRAKADLIVAHHPPIWEPLRTLDPGEPHTGLLLELAQAGIAVYATHTNLDVAPGGVNDALADRLGLEERRPLFPAEQARQLKLVVYVPESHVAEVRDAMSAAGAGQIGDYSHCSFSHPGVGTFKPGAGTNPFSGAKGAVNEEEERRMEMLLPAHLLQPVRDALFAAHPYEEVAYDVFALENTDAAVGLGVRGRLPNAMSAEAFAAHVCAALEITDLRRTGAAQGKVRNVAVLGGSGGGEIARLPGGLDAYVTGDVKYHDALLAMARGTRVYDAGHWGTEKHVPHLLADWLKRNVPGVRVSAHVEPPPFHTVTATHD